MLGVGAEQQKILRYWTKYGFVNIIFIYSVLTFSLGCIKTPKGVMPHVCHYFSAFIVH